MRLRIFTNAYNAMPFIPAQYEWLKTLKCDWSWAIAEGCAKPMHCSAWRTHLPPGPSKDGTVECLDEIAASDQRVKVEHRPEWDGIVSMSNACLPDYSCLLMQMSSDEVWKPSAIDAAIRLFEDHPRKTAASVFCNLYLGPEVMVQAGSVFGNENETNFRVLWNYLPGQRFFSYEPPVLSGRHDSFTRDETWAKGIYFDHLYCFDEKQVRQKEEYYAPSHVGFAHMHHGITERWKALQLRQHFPSAINDVFPWAPPQTMAVKVAKHPFTAYLEAARHEMPGLL